MSSEEPYRGPISLAASKYASPQHKARAAVFPSAFPSPSAPKVATNGDSTAVATKEQLAINDAKAKLNADAQLAMAQNENLKKEVEMHSAKVTKSVSSAVANTRQLLDMLRDSIRKENPTSADADLKAVDGMWLELERLLGAAQEAKMALPTFLEKQKDNMSLYHTSMVNEAFQETQDELNTQHKKVNLQHTLILEHQQTFQDYKADVEPKLKEHSDLQERVSRLTLDKGLLRSELDKIQQQLESTRADKDEDAEKIRELQKELDQLISTKQNLSAECDRCRKAIADLQEELKIAEEKATGHYEKEIRRVTEQYEQESQKTKALDALVKALRSGDIDKKKAGEKLTSELHMLQEKYKDQGAEYSKLFMDLNSQSKTAAALTTDVERLEKLNTEFNGKLSKLENLEKEVVELHRGKAGLQEQENKLQTELGAAKDEVKSAHEEINSLSCKLRQAEKENEEMEEENNDLLSKATELKNKSAALSAALADNAKLNADVQELQSKLGAHGASATDNKNTPEQLRIAQGTIATMERDLVEWTALAKRSYKEYKDLLPLSKQADAYRQENEQLKAQLAAKGQSNGGGAAASDVAYWRDKYDELLTSLD